MVDYTSKIEPEKFEFVGEEVKHRYRQAENYDPVIYAAVLHRVLDHEVDYHKSGRQIPSPSELLDILSGDCQDQAVLLNSLYTAVGLEAGFLRVKRMDKSGAHILPLLKDPLRDPDEFARMLRRFYKVQFDEFNEEICYEKRNGDYWFVADPGWSRYVGDISSLSGAYIVDNGSSWKWYDETGFQEI